MVEAQVQRAALQGVEQLFSLGRGRCVSEAAHDSVGLGNEEGDDLPKSSAPTSDFSSSSRAVEITMRSLRCRDGFCAARG
jgi:hypothetical protein